MDHVFAHFPCNDGELSYIIWEYFKPNSKIYMWKHNDNMNEINIINKLPDNSNIVFLDLTPPLNKLKTTHKYTIIDHHKEPLLELDKPLPIKNALVTGEVSLNEPDEELKI